MATSVHRITVSTPQEMEQTITSYIAQGFVVQNKTPTSATLFKRKEFNIVWAVIGLLFCALPLLIYLIVYATEQDRMVEIVITSA